MTQPWYATTLYKIHLDLHTPEWHESILSRLDAKDIISKVKNTGAKALYFFAKDCYGNAYYNTEVGHKHRCIGERDLLGEIVEEAKKQGVRIVAYYSAIWDNHAFEAHPEWRLLSLPLKASEVEEPKPPSLLWKHLCHNSGYRNYVTSMLSEIARGYEVDGFHLDMLNMDFEGISCYCKNCRSEFRERTGKELPRTPSNDPLWREFLEFRYASVERFALAMRAAIHQAKPGLFVETNYHGSPCFDWRPGQKPVRHSLYSDLNTGETYTASFGDMYPGLEARFVRNLTPGKSFELVCWRMNRHTDFTTKPLNQFRWEMFTSLANGAITMVIDQPFQDGRLDEVAYERMKEVFEEVDEFEKFFGGEPVKHVGLYYSCLSRDLYAKAEQEKFQLPVLGAYKALIESHLQVDFLFDESIALDRLREFPVIFLPNVGAMSEEEASLFRNYVEEGGNLIATGDTSLYEGNGCQLGDFQLKDLFGVRLEETLDTDANFVRGLPEQYGRGIDPRYYVLVHGPAHRVTPTGANACGDLHSSFFRRVVPERFFSHNIHPPYKRESSALFVNPFGKGKCVYLPFTPDSSYANLYELPEHRRIIANLVNSLAGPPLVKIQAPVTVESTVNIKDGKILVHLISFNPIRQSNALPSLSKPIRPSLRMEEPGIYRATIKMKAPFNSVFAQRESTKIKTKDQTIEMWCEDVYEVIEIDCREKDLEALKANED